MLYLPRLWSASAPATDWLLSLQSMDSSDLSDGAVTLQEYLELKKALATSEAKVQQLMKVNSSLSDELRRLQREVSTGWGELQEIMQGSEVGSPLLKVVPTLTQRWTPLCTLRSTNCRQRTCSSDSHQDRCLHPHFPVIGQNTHSWGLVEVPIAGTARPSLCMSQALP